MIKKSLLFLPFYLLVIESFSQDSSLVSTKKTLQIIDSLVTGVKGINKYLEFKVFGSSNINGEYTGVVYKDIDTHEVEKLRIVFDSREEEIFCHHNRILRITKHGSIYYRINGIYYNKDGLKIVKSELINDLLDSENIVGSIIRLCNNKN